jgi:hypothetical protein
MFIVCASSFACKNEGAKEKARRRRTLGRDRSATEPLSNRPVSKTYPLLSEYQVEAENRPKMMAQKWLRFMEMHFGNGSKSLTVFPHSADSREVSGKAVSEKAVSEKR